MKTGRAVNAVITGAASMSREYEKIIITVKQAYIGQPYKIFGLSLQLLSVI